VSKRPKWLLEDHRRTRLIEVIDMALDDQVSDKGVRLALIEAAQDLGELFMPPSTGVAPGAGTSWPRKRRRSR